MCALCAYVSFVSFVCALRKPRFFYLERVKSTDAHFQTRGRAGLSNRNHDLTILCHTPTVDRLFELYYPVPCTLGYGPTYIYNALMLRTSFSFPARVHVRRN